MKLIFASVKNRNIGLPPWGGSGLKSKFTFYLHILPCLPPWGGSGLKLMIVVSAGLIVLVSLLGEGVD